MTVELFLIVVFTAALVRRQAVVCTNSVAAQMHNLPASVAGISCYLLQSLEKLSEKGIFAGTPARCPWDTWPSRGFSSNVTIRAKMFTDRLKNIGAFWGMPVIFTVADFKFLRFLER